MQPAKFFTNRFVILQIVFVLFLFLCPAAIESKRGCLVSRFLFAMFATKHRAHQSFCRISYGKADKVWGSFAWSPSMAFMPYVAHGARMKFWVESYESWNNKIKVEDRAGCESVIFLGVSVEVVNPSRLPSSRMPAFLLLRGCRPSSFEVAWVDCPRKDHLAPDGSSETGADCVAFGAGRWCLG